MNKCLIASPAALAGLAWVLVLFWGCAGNPGNSEDPVIVNKLPTARDKENPAEPDSKPSKEPKTLPPLVVDKGQAVETKKPNGLPALVIDKSAPLLLDEPTEDDTEAHEEGTADNDACLHCHAKYKKEPLAVRHAKEDVGCVTCHGKSFAHRNDENNTTPPEKMYPAHVIDAACGKCHETHDAPASRVIARFQKRCPRKDPKAIVCTDCHGDHRKKVRSVRWNKTTGALITD